MVIDGQGIIIELLSSCVKEMSRIGVDLGIFFRDNSDQEIQQHDHTEELVEEPDNPDEVDHDLSGSAFGILFIFFVVPQVIFGSSNITD